MSMKSSPFDAPFVPERLVGHVTSLSQAEVEIIVAEDCDADFNPGSYIIIDRDPYALLGQVREIAGAGDDTVINAEILSSIELSASKVIPGILASPHIKDNVYSPTSDFIEAFISAELTGDNSSEKSVTLTLAKVADKQDTPVIVAPEKLFGRHCAVLGATGGGKSWTLARIIEECAIYKSKLILIDATGEYGSLSSGTTHVHFGEDDTQTHSKEVALPYYHLTEQDLFAIFKPTGASQAPKLRGAMRSLKLAKVSQSVGIDGLVIKAHKSKKQFERSMQYHQDEIDTPYPTFDIRLLARQIENECVDPQRSSMEPDVWGGVNAIDLANCTPLIGRINDILQSPNLDPIFKPGRKVSLFDELGEFFRDPVSRVFRLNMKNLSFAHNVRSIIANSIGRYLFELAAKGLFRKRPLLLVLDEAHQFLKEHRSSVEDEYLIDSFGLIAKEGRKYALNFLIATQRPRDIPEDVLSQMGTILVHRLINDGDRSIIERACGDVDKSSVTLIPTLAPGEAVLAGVDFPMPLHVRIIPPISEPSSSGANYQKFWGK